MQHKIHWTCSALSYRAPRRQQYPMNRAINHSATRTSTIAKTNCIQTEPPIPRKITSKWSPMDTVKPQHRSRSPSSWSGDTRSAIQACKQRRRQGRQREQRCPQSCQVDKYPPSHRRLHTPSLVLDAHQFLLIGTICNPASVSASTMHFAICIASSGSIR